MSDLRKRLEKLLEDAKFQALHMNDKGNRELWRNHAATLAEVLAEVLAALAPSATERTEPPRYIAGFCQDREKCVARNAELKALKESLARVEVERSQDACPYCGGTKGHWEGCKAPVGSNGDSGT